MTRSGHSQSDPSQLRSTASNLHSRGDEISSNAHPTPLTSGSMGQIASGTEGTINSHLGSLPDHVSRMANRVHQGGSNLESNASNIEHNEATVASSFRAIGSGPKPPVVKPLGPGGPYYVASGNGKRTRVDPPPDVVSLNHPGLNTGQPLPDTVYRADTRPPSEIFQNGFTSHGNDYNLWQHQSGGGFLDNSGYISTTQKPGAATQFLKPSTGQNGIMTDNGVIYQYRQGQVYHIEPTGNMVHLPSQQMTGNLQDTYSAQAEWAAVHHIDPQNIQGVSTHSGYYSIGGQNAPPPNTPHPNNQPPTYQPNPGFVSGHSGYNPYHDPNSGFNNQIPNITDKPAGLDSDSDSDGDSDSESE
jgi:hypothetical protein